MLNKRKFREKLGGGFALVLLLTLLVAWLGWRGLNEVADKYEKSDAATQLVSNTYLTRQAEKDFIHSQDTDAVKTVQQGIKQLWHDAELTQTKFKDPLGQQQINAIKSGIERYENAFREYVDLVQQAQDAQTMMRNAAVVALAQADAIHRDQNQQLNEIRQRARLFLKDKVALSNDAAKLLELIYQVKAARIELVNAPENKQLLAQWENINTTLVALVKKLKQHFLLEKNIAQADAVLAYQDQYNQTILDYVKQHQIKQQQQQAKLEELTQVAQTAMQEMLAIRADQKNQLNTRLNRNALRISDRLRKSADVNHISKWYLEARYNEKQFILSADTHYAEAVQKRLQQAISLADDLITRFHDHDITQGRALSTALKDYAAAFQRYVDITYKQQKQRTALAEEMRTAAEHGLNEAETIRLVQQTELNKLRATTLTFHKDNLNNVNDINQLLEWILEVKMLRIQVTTRQQANQDPQLLQSWQQLDQQIMAVVQDLGHRFSDPAITDQTDTLNSSYAEYQTLFNAYLDSADAASLPALITHESLAIDILQKLRDLQHHQLKEKLTDTSVRVDDKFSKEQDTGRIIKWYLIAQHHEKQFMLTHRDEHIGVVSMNMNNAINLARNLTRRFTEQADIKQGKSLVAALQSYQRAFDLYSEVSLSQEQQKNQQLATMQRAAETTLSQIDTILAEQELQLSNILEQAIIFRQDKLATADDANRLLKLALDLQALRIQLMYNYDPQLLAQWEQRNDEIVTLAQDLKQRFSRAKDQQQAEKILTRYAHYRQLFHDYLVAQVAEDEWRRQQLAQAEANDAQAIAQVTAISADQQAQLFKRMQQNEVLVSDKLDKAQQTQAIVKNYLDIRRDEKQFLLTGDEETAERMRADLYAILQLVQTLNSGFTYERSVKQAKKVIVSLQNYQKAFEAFYTTLKARQEKEHNMIVHAKQVEEVGQMTRAQQQQAMQSVIYYTELMLVSGLLVVIVVGMVIAVMTTFGVVRPLKRAVHLAGELAAGNLAARAPVTNTHDEMGQLLQAMNAMASDLQAVIIETSSSLAKLAAGNTQLQIERHFAGDFVEIKNALHTTATQLAHAHTENERQNWLKSGQAQLNDKISGEQELVHLAENILAFLTPYIDAHVATFYIAEEQDGEVMLRMLASYAHTWRKTVGNVYKLGESLVGQAALERKPIIITQTDEYVMNIRSGMGEAKPASILVLPITYEKQLKGVVEFGAFHVFTITQLDFLRQVMSNIGVAINTTQSRTQMQALLQQSREQAERLQVQAAEMEQQQAALREVNEELQAQQEELQVQQEELRQTNEELEERGRVLEQQRQAVEEKNRALEQTKVELQTKAEELTQISKYKSEFLANMSHELRTPLNSLLILAQLLAENKDQNLNEQQIECAQTIHSAGADLLNLINEILDLSKVEAGKVEIHPETIVLQELADSLKQKFRHVAADKGLQFNIELDAHAPTQIYTDLQRLKQVLNNLLSNALKFTLTGSVSLKIAPPALHIDLNHSGLSHAHSICFSVIDTGIGIPEDKQASIFEAFQQADGTTSRKFGGTGLGLSISRQLVELMGGEIHLHSEPDQGSQFSIFLPLQCQTVAEASGTGGSVPVWPVVQQAAQPESDVLSNSVLLAAPTTQPSSGVKADTAVAPAVVKTSVAVIDDDRTQLRSGDKSQKSLLIIEDDAQFTKLLLQLGREEQFLCLVAHDGQEGLALAAEYLPQAIILDVGLPHVDGWTVMEKLKDNPATRHIPVHFVSGQDNAHQARSMGAIGYALKPISKSEMADAFKKIENFIQHDVKKLLVVSDDDKHQQAIIDLVGQSDGVNTTVAHTLDAAHQYLTTQAWDCMVLDVNVDNHRGLSLLERYQTDDITQIPPVLIYAERSLEPAEAQQLARYTETLTVKTVHSPERLLDEAILFLHQIEANLPAAQRDMLQMMHNPERILKGKKILLVDDDIRNTFALGASLGQKSMDVEIASNGIEALQMLEKYPNVDLVLMDIMMPEMDGYETMRRIRQQPQYQKLPIIALTAKAMKEDRSKCIEAGANDYLAKPVDTDKLLSLMRVWLYQ